MGRLTALAARALSRPGRHGDGDGLYLHVTPAGSKSWVQRIVVDGRRRDIGLGPYPTVSLARARAIAHDNRTAVAEGRDPVAEKRQVREAARRPAPSIPTFAEAAARVIELRRPTWSNAKHASQWESTLAAYVHPVIGNKTVDAVTPADAMDVLTPIWTSKPETASRVRQRMETVMDWAVTHGYRLDNPAGRSLLKVLPSVKRLKEHRQALPYVQVPGAVALVRECTADIPTKLAFEFLVLTAGRSVEVRAAEWSEIDREAAAWEVPAARMKARRPHRVPLPGRALEILKEASRFGGEQDLVFPATRSGRAESPTTFTALLRRLGIPAVPHGFRSSFRDWVIEQTSTPWAVAEAALAHNVGNSTEAAYMRSDLFDQRRALMNAWAAYVIGGEGERYDG
jgi:integrase